MLCMVLVTLILCVNPVSAWEWDNVKSYDSETKTVSIRNSIIKLFPTNEIAKLELIENTDTCLVNCTATLKLDLHIDYEDVFKLLKFYNAEDMSEERTLDNYDILVRTKTTEIEVLDYEEQCRDGKMYPNKSVERICETVQSGSHIEERYEHEPLGKRQLTAGTYYLVINGKKSPYESLDWIPENFMGIKIQEWASWNSTYEIDLVGYWGFDEGTGTFAENEIDGGVNNLTLISSGCWNSTAKDGGSALTIGVSCNASVDSDSNLDTVFSEVDTNYTIAFWIQFADTGGAWNVIMSKKPAGSQDIYSLTTTTTQMGMTIRKQGGQNSITKATIGQTTGQYYFLVYTKNQDQAGHSNANTLEFYNASVSRAITDEIDNAYTDLSNTANLLWIGGRTNHGAIGAMPGVNGIIDELMIWNRTLSPAEVTDLWNNGDGIFIEAGAPADSTPPNVTFNTQDPIDVDSTNLFGRGLNITYNISDETALNTTTVILRYTTNTSTSNATNYFLNGTTREGFVTSDFTSNVSHTFLFVVDEDEVYPGTHNIDSAIMANTDHSIELLDSSNKYGKIEMINVSDDTQFNFLMIMVNASVGAGSMDYYYCNSTYVTGNPTLNSNCIFFFSEAKSPTFNSTNNASSARIVPFAINTTDGTVGTVKVTSTSQFLVRGSPMGSGLSFYHVPLLARTGASQTTANGGTTWTNQTYTFDVVLHQFSNSSVFNYQSCANDTAGNENCSVIRTDLLQLGNLPPSSPVVFNPSTKNYGGNVNINYTSSVSPNGYAIDFYNISLADTNQTFISSIRNNNSVNLSFVWDSSAISDGNYTIIVEATDNQSQSSTGHSEIFSLDNSPPAFTNISNISILVNQSVNANFTATDIIEFDSFVINNTNNFSITQDGNLTNITSLNGTYFINITINDSANNINSEVIWVNVTDLPPPELIPPYFTSIPDPINREYLTGGDLGVVFTGADETSTVTYAVNDTVHYTINASGFLFNSSTLRRGNHSLNVSIADASGNSNSTIYNFGVEDVLNPYQTFNNTFNAENMTFAEDQNITRYARLPTGTLAFATIDVRDLYGDEYRVIIDADNLTCSDFEINGVNCTQMNMTRWKLNSTYTWNVSRARIMHTLYWGSGDESMNAPTPRFNNTYVTNARQIISNDIRDRGKHGVFVWASNQDSGSSSTFTLTGNFSASTDNERMSSWSLGSSVSGNTDFQLPEGVVLNSGNGDEFDTDTGANDTNNASDFEVNAFSNGGGDLGRIVAFFLTNHSVTQFTHAGGSTTGHYVWDSFENSSMPEFEYSSTNWYLDVGGDGDADFNGTDGTRSGNIASEIFDYFSTCVLDNGFCDVPLVFHSDTDGVLEYSNINFDEEGFLENSQTFNANTVEGATETFIINLTKSTSQAVSTINLIYNNTIYPSPYLVTGNEVIASTTIAIPFLTTPANISFHFNVTFTDGTSFLSLFNTQSVGILNVDDCSSYNNTIYNFTHYDEETKALINNGTIEVQFNLYDLAKSSLLINFSQTFENTNPVSICLESSLLATTNYSSYVTAKYHANETATNTSYAIEYYHILNQTLTDANTPNQIDLYSLKDSDSTEFQLTFRDSDYNLAPNILVQIHRQYIADNDFKIVEIPLTDSNGQTILNLVRNNIVYNLIMVDEAGTVVATFNSIKAFCADFTIGECTINLNAPPSIERVYEYDEEFDISTTAPSYDNNTEEVQVSFITADLLPKTVRIDVVRNNDFGNRSVCSNSLTSASGTLTCDVSGITDSDQFLFTSLYVDGELHSQNTVNLNASTLRFDTVNGGFYAFLLILFLICLFMEDRRVLLISLGLGWVIVISLGLVNGKFIGIGSAGIWLLVSISMMLWKLNKEESP